MTIQFPSAPLSWPSIGLRRASINSFGFGGANAHVIVDDAYSYLRIHSLKGNHSTIELPPAASEIQNQSFPDFSSDSDTHRLLLDTSTVNQEKKLIVFSAADENGITRLTKIYSEYFKSSPHAPGLLSAYWDNLIYTLNSRRSSLQYKSFAAVSSLLDFSDLSSIISKPTKSTERGQPKLGFVFTGQGAQWAGMATGLAGYHRFRNSLHRAEMVLTELGCSWSLMGLYGPF